MDLSASLSYSFRSSNIPKILTIVLIFVIAGVSIFVAAMGLESLPLMMLLAPVGLAYALFISGYTISIIKSVLEGDDELPEFDWIQNLGRGFMIFVANIVYLLPVIVIFACAVGMTAAGSASTASRYGNADDGAMLMFCGSMLLAFGMGIILMYSFIVAQIRYAVDGSAGSLFNIGKNFSIVMSNIGKTSGHFVRAFALGIVFSIISSILTTMIRLPFMDMLQDLNYAYADAINRFSYYGPEYRFDPDIIFDMGMPLIMFASIYYVVTLTLSLMQGFSSAHLIAGYGKDLGLGGHSGKSKGGYIPYDSDDDPYDL